MPRAQIKDEQTYQKLRDEGESKEKSASGPGRSELGAVRL